MRTDSSGSHSRGTVCWSHLAKLCLFVLTPFALSRIHLRSFPKVAFFRMQIKFPMLVLPSFLSIGLILSNSKKEKKNHCLLEHADFFFFIAGLILFHTQTHTDREHN